MGVRFRMHNDGTRQYEVCEFRYDDGRVSVFPANEKDGERSATAGRSLTFAEAYPDEYRAFKGATKAAPKVKAVKTKPKAKTKAKNAKKVVKAKKRARR